MDFLKHNWWLVLALILWIMRVNKEQKKRVARKKAEQEAQTTISSDGQLTDAPAAQPITPNVQKEPFFLDDDYAFQSPVAVEEKQDERARAEAFEFKPVEKEEDASEAKVNEYSFKSEGAFPAFEPPSEEVTAGDYFPQGIQSRLSQSFLSADDLRRSIITMEILLPPRSKRPRR